MKPVEENMSDLRKKLDEIGNVDTNEIQVLKTQAFILAKKLIENSDRLVQRFIGFQEEIKRSKYPPNGVKEIMDGFKETEQKLNEITKILDTNVLRGNNTIIDLFNDVQKIYKKQNDEFYSQL